MPEAEKISGDAVARRTNLHGSRARLALYHVLLLSGLFVFWYAMTEPGLIPPFYFDALGKPFLPADLPSGGAQAQSSSFATTTISVEGDNLSIPVTIYQETGYVD